MVLDRSEMPIIHSSGDIKWAVKCVSLEFAGEALLGFVAFKSD